MNSGYARLGQSITRMTPPRTYAGRVNESQPDVPGTAAAQQSAPAPQTRAGSGLPAAPSRRWAAAAGVVAAGAGLVASELIAGFVSPSLSTMTAVGGVVIDVVPPGVKDWAVALFGTADKLALLAGMALVIAALAAFAGVLELRRRLAGAAVFAVFGLVGVAAVLTRAQVTVPAVALPVLAAGIGGLLMQSLIARLGEWRASGRDAGGDVRPDAAKNGPDAAKSGRRGFLSLLGGSSGAVLVGGAVATAWRGGAAGVNELRRTLHLPAPRSQAVVIPPGAEIGLDGMQPLVTPNPDFYRI